MGAMKFNITHGLEYCFAIIAYIRTYSLSTYFVCVKFVGHNLKSSQCRRVCNYMRFTALVAVTVNGTI